jgi:hypothetical protein
MTMKRLGPEPDGPRRIARDVSLRELEPRIFDQTYTIAERQAFLAAVKRRQRGVPE